MTESSSSRPWLYDPSLGGVLVRAHRSPGAGAAGSVVSDTLWNDVLGVLRWAEATSTCPTDLIAGAAWRTAAASARSLRRLPRLCAEAGVPWPGPAPAPAAPDGAPRQRLQAAAARLALRLCDPEEDSAGPLRRALSELARDLDEVGAAAVAVLAEGTDWTSAG
jgi:hypothetical protein